MFSTVHGLCSKEAPCLAKYLCSKDMAPSLANTVYVVKDWLQSFSKVRLL